LLYLRVEPFCTSENQLFSMNVSITFNQKLTTQSTEIIEKVQSAYEKLIRVDIAKILENSDKTNQALEDLEKSQRRRQ